MKPFQITRIAAAIALAGGLCLPGVGMAADFSAPLFLIHDGAYVVTNESGETVAIDDQISEEIAQELARMQAAWEATLERISNAPSRQFTLEELAQMVDDGYWSAESLKRIVAVELPDGEGPVRVSLPSDALGDTVWTPEDNRSLLPAMELFHPDGSLRVRVWLVQDYVLGTADDEGNSPPVTHDPEYGPDYWTPERWKEVTPVEYPFIDSPWGPVRPL